MGKTVLIVDDSVSTRQLVVFTLKSVGYNIIEAESGKDALQKLNGSSIDMAIVDLNMPDMDGMELVKQLRRKEDYRSTPVVILTTEYQEARKEQGAALGTNAWITKPCSPDQLLNVVRTFVR